MNKHWSRIGICLLVLSARVFARDLHVDPAAGNDSADGISAPVRSIAKGVSLLQAGDTLHLAKATYHSELLIRNQSGEPGKPIIIDGHGATLTGCDPLNPADWEQESPGLYKSSTLYKILKADDTVIQRWFFVLNGKPQLMNRTSKGAKSDWKKPEELQVGEWTFLPESQVFYIKIDPAVSLASAGVEIPYRKNGVTVRGEKNAHWIIRNLNVTRVSNDGFNLHTNSSDMRFENISAIECGDDGFSAHEGCECEVDGFLATGNSTGFTNGFTSKVKLKNALLANNVAAEFMQFHDCVFEAKDTVIISSGSQPVRVYGNPEKSQTCHGSLENVLIINSGARRRPIEIGKNGVVNFTRVTSINCAWLVLGEANVSESVLAGSDVRASLEIRPDGIWRAAKNVYDFRSFIHNGNAIAGNDLGAFQKITGQDEGSRAETIGAEKLKSLQNRDAVFSPNGADLKGANIPAIKD